MYILDEKKRQRLNQPGINPKNGGEDIEMRMASTNSQHAENCWSVEHARLNTVSYNRIIVEVYHIGILTLAITVTLAAVAAKKAMKKEFTAEDYSPTLLRFLDLTPRVLYSLIVPMTIYVRIPEIQAYVRGFF